VATSREQSTAGVSLNVRECMLIRNQLGNGTWGLYRSAAGRARILEGSSNQVDRDAQRVLDTSPPFEGESLKLLFKLLRQAFDRPDDVIEFSSSKHGALVEVMAAITRELPHAPFLWERVVDQTPLTKLLAHALLAEDEPLEAEHTRAFLEKGIREWPEHEPALRDVLRCEAFIGPLEELFRWLCFHRGRSIEEVGPELPIDPEALGHAQDAFRNSGHYPPGGARDRWDLYAREINCSSKQTIAESLLGAHLRVAQVRRRAPWVSIGDQRELLVEVDLSPTEVDEIIPERSWEHSYYLPSLDTMARAIHGRLSQ
ncbi:MAG: hypothetical protein KC416_16580, partial [Myxococcales bacterium]|nr:hypothetical protein [Myxococcales bacterium]